mmetsp:Transcript_13554/g.13481  ORF Transcript_13554/g.13481 Transcript_13554/m.13481 type:complete len:99 (+) Transcript_13554:189-485(+)
MSQDANSKVLESSVSDVSECDLNLHLRSQHDILEESLYTITEEESNIDFLAEEEEDSLVADEEKASKPDRKLNSLKKNVNKLKIQKKHTFEAIRDQKL